MQSAHPDDLRLLEREHTYQEVIQSVKWARQAGFDNLNLDLMFGLPHQTLARWQASLELAVDLHPEHLSLYALTLEHGTPFQRWTERGLIPARTTTWQPSSTSGPRTASKRPVITITRFPIGH